MERAENELDFASFKDNFEDVCNEVNGSNETVTLTLKSGRKVFIVPEENYDKISRFVVKDVTINAVE